MLLLTMSVGLVVWAASHSYHDYKLNSIFQDKLSERFNKEAKDHRTRFYRYLNLFNPAVKTYASNVNLINYIQSEQWLDNTSPELILHKNVPVWLPKLSIMRSYLWPHYAMLFDKSGTLRELYHYRNPMPPKDLLNLTLYDLELSREQSFITMRGNQPYVISAEYTGEIENSPIMLIASTIDEELLKLSQGSVSGDTIIAILKDEESTILVSSNNELVPQNSELSQMEKNYLITSEDHFDTGSSDLLIKFVSFISTEEVRQQTDAVLAEDRRIAILSALGYIISFAFVMYWITSRIQNLTRRVVKFSEGMQITQPHLNKKNKLVELESRFELLMTAIQTETMALEHQALHDPLTNMPNRKMFNNYLQNSISSSAYTNKKFILILSDLDRFKDIILQQVGERLHETLRSNDMVARLGGDEFGVILADTTLDQAVIILKKILDSFELPFNIEGHHLDIGISMGVVEYPLHGDDVNILIQRADVAMYNAKNKRMGFSAYESSEDSHAVSRLALAAELRQALNNKLLQLYYQPKIDLKTGMIYGAEALLRWDHAERGFISPDEFIPLAEHTGLIQPITYMVMEQAAKQCELWNEMGHKMEISINISMNCMHDAKLPADINKIILSKKISPDQIMLELTENIFIKDPVRSKKILDNISSMGIGISIDDFGTGYSSLAYLKQLPVNELKIDRSFVMEMLDDESDEVIVRTTIDLAHNMDIKVVAEGVESQEIMNKLKEFNCNSAQGYYLGRPMQADQFIEHLNKNKNKKF